MLPTKKGNELKCVYLTWQTFRRGAGEREEALVMIYLLVRVTFHDLSHVKYICSKKKRGEKKAKVEFSTILAALTVLSSLHAL